tara:strand:- start:9675 stop:10340 length:666 start_codon:yes stop_codon:yes gene_type:complete
MNIEIKWPEGATHKIDSLFKKWVDGAEFSLKDGEWVKAKYSWTLDKYKLSRGFKVIERPVDAPYMPKVDEWFTAANGDEYMLIGKTSYGHFVVESRETVVIRFPSLKGARPIKTELDQFMSAVAEAVYMPKVGEWCDYRTVQKGEHRKAFFIGHNESGEHVLKDVHGDFIEDNCNFRPIKTERDILIDIISLNINMDIASSGIASAILAAGFTSIKKGDKR